MIIPLPIFPITKREWQRAFLVLCLLSLFGCSSSPCRQWEMQEILTKIPCFNGGRLILGPDSPSSHLELELLRNRSGLHLYLNLLFLYAPPCSEDATRTRIEIIFQDQAPWTVYPYLLEGRQRLLLPAEVADTLIQALLEGSSFTIQVGRNHFEVVPDQFAKLYGLLLALPIEEVNPKG